MATATHTTLDGSVVRIAGDVDLGRPATSVGVVAIGPRRVRHELTGGNIQFADEFSGVIGVPLTETLTLQRGTLRVGVGAAAAGWAAVGVWSRDAAAVLAFLYNSAGVADLVGLFDRFELDVADGAPTIRPKPSGDTAFENPPSLLKEAQDVGLLHVSRPTHELVRTLPAWEGTRVAGGELFSISPGENRWHFLLVNESAIVTISPRRGVVGDADFYDRLATLRVEFA